MAITPSGRVWADGAFIAVSALGLGEKKTAPVVRLLLKRYPPRQLGSDSRFAGATLV